MNFYVLMKHQKVITLIQMIPYIKNVLKHVNFVMEKEMKQIIIAKNVNLILHFMIILIIIQIVTKLAYIFIILMNYLILIVLKMKHVH